MSAALFILLGLLFLCLASLTTPFASSFLHLVPLLVAVGLIAVSHFLPPGETQYLASLLSWPLALMAFLPALLMILQILPLPFVAHPLWGSVRAGFPSKVGAHIGVDIGATAITLANYISVIGTVVFAAAVSIDRKRAEWVLFAASAVAVLISLACLANDLLVADVIALRDEGLDAACLGITLTSACGLLFFERSETHRRKSIRGGRNPNYLIHSVLCLTGFVICASAVGMARSSSLTFAASSGFLTLLAAAAIRRWALGRLGIFVIGATAAVVVAALAPIAASGPDPRLAFAKTDAASIELTQTILNDAPVLGVGAGSFAALLPIYQSSRSIPSEDMKAATTAAKLSIEMGQITLWFAVLSAVFAIFALLRGAMSRRRDSFYAGAAGACLMVLLILAFINTGLTGSAITYLAAVISGLGLAQTKSRSVL